jgi:hypothetical protein
MHQETPAAWLTLHLDASTTGAPDESTAAWGWRAPP